MPEFPKVRDAGIQDTRGSEGTIINDVQITIIKTWLAQSAGAHLDVAVTRADHAFYPVLNTHITDRAIKAQVPAVQLV